MQRKKILFISSWFPNKTDSTAGNFVQRHAEAVAVLHDVEILHAIGYENQKEKYVLDDRIINGIRTIIVYYRNTKSAPLNFLRKMRGYLKGFALLQKPDIVHGNVLHNSMFFAVYLKLRYKIPFVVSEHWSGFLNVNRKKLSKSQLFTSKIIANNAQFILPVSHFLLNNLHELGWKTEFAVIENVVNTDLFTVNYYDKKTFTFLHISNLIQLKNPKKIISAALKLNKEFNNFELQIGGDGDVESLKKIIEKNKAESFIKTFPTLSMNEVADKMSSCNCFVLFSDYESFGCVVLESLSCGVPVISTKVGAVTEIINNTNGLLISNSEEELYEAMKKVLENKVKFASPKKLHDDVEMLYSINIIAKKFNDIYRNVLL